MIAFAKAKAFSMPTRRGVACFFSEEKTENQRAMHRINGAIQKL
jgi:hypothetical protein